MKTYIKLKEPNAPLIPVTPEESAPFLKQDSMNVDPPEASPTTELYLSMPFKLRKGIRAAWLGFTRPSGIDRTRKRQIQKARFMDKGSYEYSQYWRKQYGKFRREATRYSKRNQAE